MHSFLLDMLKPRVLKAFNDTNALEGFLLKHHCNEILCILRYHCPILRIKLKFLLEDSFEDLFVVITLKRRITAEHDE